MPGRVSRTSLIYGPMKLLFLFTILFAAGCRPAGEAAKPQHIAAEAPVFRDSIVLPTAKVKNQARSGTCWAFGTVAVMESELLREDPARQVDLSEMWFVRHAYREKAVRYVRTRGAQEFGQGGELYDVLHLMKRYGVVPQEVYDGRCRDGEYDHRALARAVHRWAERTVRKRRYAEEGWMEELDALLDERLGPCPGEFEAEGVRYTPAGYAEALGLRAEEYVSLTSFTHHPFYEPFVLELRDNWTGEASLNVPLDTLVAAVNRALAAGHTVGWNADISEPGFRWLHGMAGVRRGTDCSQEGRQEAFDRLETTDDHVMQIVGLARSGEGRKAYKVRNSWGVDNARGGYLYVSEGYLRLKTVEVLLPRAIVGRSAAGE